LSRETKKALFYHAEPRSQNRGGEAKRVKQSSFGLPGQYGRYVTKANGWGKPSFPKLPKENKNSINMSSACLFKKSGAQNFIILFATPFLSVFTQEFSLAMWLHMRPENELTKYWSVLILLGLSDRPKKKVSSSATSNPHLPSLLASQEILR